jgi:hypothetical protein
MQSEYAGIAWVVFSVLVLCISGFINGLGYKERAALVKDSYEALNGLCQRAKQDQNNTNNLTNEYEKILSICENHIDIDYYLALCNAYLINSNPSGNTTGLDRMPTKYIWLCVIFHHIKRFLLLGVLYLLPVLLFLAMEFRDVYQGKI